MMIGDFPRSKRPKLEFFKLIFPCFPSHLPKDKIAAYQWKWNN